MKRSISFLVISVITAFFINSCASGNKEQLIPPCKTDNLDYQVSYQNDVVPILENNCYRCHGTGSTAGSGGIELQDTTTLNKYIDNGQLVANITHKSSNPMPPPPAQMLSSCEISQITRWIDQGAAKN